MIYLHLTGLEKDLLVNGLYYSKSQQILVDGSSYIRVQISTYRIWRQNNNSYYLRKHFWKEKTFWSDGYFACSIGNISKETIEQYIKSQG